jgi:hypothetical protein
MTTLDAQDRTRARTSICSFLFLTLKRMEPMQIDPVPLWYGAGHATQHSKEHAGKKRKFGRRIGA